MSDGVQPLVAPPAEARPAPDVAGLFGDLVGRGNLLSRVIWAAFFAGPLAVLTTALFLTPSPLGHSTHTQLGLPPCGFLVATGYPCPGCGLTTSFTHMVRLEVFGALGANPFGVLLFLATVAIVPVAAFGMIRRLPVVDTLDRLHAEKIAIFLSVVSLSVWGVKVALQYMGA
jgi:hypothetical protein